MKSLKSVFFVNISWLNSLQIRKFIVCLLLIVLMSCGGGGDDLSNNIIDIGKIANSTPVADAGDDQTVFINTSVILNAVASIDADNDSLTYIWSLLSAPSNSDLLLTNNHQEQLIFIPDTVGEYRFALVVNDGQVDSEQDVVTVIAEEAETTIELTYAIVDTNQTQCYSSTAGATEPCTAKGYDADYFGFQPSYKVNAAGATVTDSITGLTWQQSSDVNVDGNLNYDDKLFQYEAISYCEDLELAGRDDWRLPSVKEAYSLILFSGKDASNYLGVETSGLTPFLAPEFDWAFGDLDSGIDRIIDAQYASTTEYISDIMSGQAAMFGVNYIDGRIKGYPLTNKKYYVRCVTGNEQYGINNFQDNADLTITDNATGLMWQQNDAESIDWDDAIEQCEAATTAGYFDWRLPNIKELHSILDYTVSPDTHASAAISSLFNATVIINEEGVQDWAYYWASTTHVDNNNDGTNATYMSFGRALGYMNSALLDVHGAGAHYCCVA